MGEVIKLEQYEESIRLLEQKAIKAKYWVGEERGEKFIQLDTFGSDQRKFKGKQSQTMRFSKDIAIQLKKSFKKIFQNRLTFFNKEPERIVQALLFAHRESGEKGFNKVESLGRERGGVWGGEREPF